LSFSLSCRLGAVKVCWRGHGRDRVGATKALFMDQMTLRLTFLCCLLLWFAVYAWRVCIVTHGVTPSRLMDSLIVNLMSGSFRGLRLKI
jgi:hypothetical protein